jgi:hypothetical protein
MADYLALAAQHLESSCLDPRHQDHHLRVAGRYAQLAAISRGLLPGDLQTEEDKAERGA